MLEPYGVSNPVPLFIVRNATIVDINGVSDGKHTKLILGNGRTTQSAMYFSNSPESLGVYVGDKVDILFSIDINEWQDRKSVQLIIRDLKPSQLQSDLENKERNRFEEIKNGAPFTRDEDVLPERGDFVVVYKFIQNAAHNGTYTFTHRDICSRVSVSPGCKIGYIKLKFIIMIFREMNIVDIEEDNETYTFRLHFSSNKKNLEKSSILKKLRSQIR